MGNSLLQCKASPGCRLSFLRMSETVCRKFYVTRGSPYSHLSEQTVLQRGCLQVFMTANSLGGNHVVGCLSVSRHNPKCWFWTSKPSIIWGQVIWRTICPWKSQQLRRHPVCQYARLETDGYQGLFNGGPILVKYTCFCHWEFCREISMCFYFN